MYRGIGLYEPEYSFAHWFTSVMAMMELRVCRLLELVVRVATSAGRVEWTTSHQWTSLAAAGRSGLVGRDGCLAEAPASTERGS